MKDRVVALVKEHEEGEKFKYLTYIKGLARDLYTSWYESRDPNGEIWPNPCQFIEFEPVMVCTTLPSALKRLNNNSLPRPSSKKWCHSTSRFSFIAQVFQLRI